MIHSLPVLHGAQNRKLNATNEALMRLSTTGIHATFLGLMMTLPTSVAILYVPSSLVKPMAVTIGAGLSASFFGLVMRSLADKALDENTRVAGESKPLDRPWVYPNPLTATLEKPLQRAARWFFSPDDNALPDQPRTRA